MHAKKKSPRVLAAGLTVLLAMGMAVGSAIPALADGTRGEVRGYLWPGADQPIWEGTYRMPNGQEAWCASVWQPEPFYADSYGEPVTLTMNNGEPMTPEDMETLAYVISTASDVVIYKTGQDADDYAAATAIIVHDMTNSNKSAYNPELPLSYFDAKTDPLNTGQDPTRVRGIYNTLLADAALYGGEWKIVWDTPPNDVVAGDSIQLFGTLSTVSGTQIPDRELRLAANGIVLDSSTVTTDASGRFQVTGTVGDSDVSVTASITAPPTTVMMRKPIGWETDQPPQNMILVDDDQLEAAIEVEVEPQSLGTSARDQADDDRIIPADGGTIVDTVTYTGLTPGTQYTLKGELYDKATGESTGITATETFTPDRTSGTTEVVFTIPVGFAGTSLVVFEHLYDPDNNLVAEHTDINDEAQTIVVEEYEPWIGTSARDQADDDRIIPADGGTIVDTVTYTGLTPGTQYTLKGELYDKATGESTGITATATFGTEQSSGTTEVVFTIPVGFAGTSLVVFEHLYDPDNNLVAEHTDINDEAQTIVVEEYEPWIGTSARDQADDDRIIPADGGTIIDTVTYTGLTPGTQYTLKGVMVEKPSGKRTSIESEVTFTPETSSGTVEVKFRVPGGHAGKTLVVFEYLYDAEGNLVAEHADINDEAQTITVQSQKAVRAALASTGANGELIPIALIGAALLLALGISAIVSIRRRH